MNQEAQPDAAKTCLCVARRPSSQGYKPRK